MMRRKKFGILFFLYLFIFPVVSIQGQESLSFLRNTTGFWLGSLTPIPGTSLSSRLNTNLGLGLMYRRQLLPTSYLELTFSWAYLDSNEESTARIIPFTIAYAHQFVIRNRLSFFIKTGIGSTFLDISPLRRSGSLPTLFLGIELAVRATPTVNVGVRFDYLYLYESNLSAPIETINPIPFPPGTDPRFVGGQQFIRRDSHFGAINLYFTFNH